MKKIIVGLCAFVLILGGCSSDKEEETVQTEENETPKQPELTSLLQFQESYADDTPVVVLQTNMGDITIVLFPEEAPKASENFMTHAQEGYYNGVTFHRVMDEFMIQGGDPTATGTGGESIWGSPFKDEFSDQLYNFRGALSMANSGKNTNGSQFFIVQANTAQQIPSSYPQIVIDKYREVGGTPWLDGVHTVFGQVIRGMDVVDAIAKVETDATSNKPIEDVVINNAVVTTYGEVK